MNRDKVVLSVVTAFCFFVLGGLVGAIVRDYRTNKVDITDKLVPESGFRNQEPQWYSPIQSTEVVHTDNFVRKVVEVYNKCSKCGEYCNSRFCTECGHEQESYYYYTYACSKCGRRCYDKYCPNCGSKTVYKKVKR